MAEAVGRGDRRGCATSWCRPAPAPARASATWCPPSSAGQKTVVATATKNLQDQLVGRDLPFLAGHLARAGSRSPR